MSARGKPRRRNSEKRKEKSRDAARSRRGKETEVYYELAQQLPLPNGIGTQLDKASIMRLSISHVKLQSLLHSLLDPKLEDEAKLPVVLDRKLDQQYQKALDGFMLIIADEGDMMYVSEKVSKHVGLTQNDLIGHCVYDYTHPCDHEEIQELVQKVPCKTTPMDTCSFFMRFKSTLTTKGRNINLKGATYKVLHCTGRHLLLDLPPRSSGPASMSCLMLVAEPIPHPSYIDIPLGTSTFLTRHNMDMTFTYCDDKMQDLLGYQSKSLIGHSLFDYHHAMDGEVIDKAFKNLYSKGQTVTPLYRFLVSGGGYVWVTTQATIIMHTRTEKPQFIVCVNFIISSVEESQQILSSVQLKQPKDEVVCMEEEEEEEEEEEQEEEEEEELDTDMLDDEEENLGCSFQPATMSVFKEFDSTISKQDLTSIENWEYRAPSAGDVVTPLTGRINTVYKDSLEAEMDRLHYQPTSEVAQLSMAESKLPNQATIHGAIPLSLNTETPRNTAQVSSPESVPSLMSPSQSESNYDSSTSQMVADQTALFMEDMDDIDYNMRAPYIPMDGEADQLFNMDLPITLIDDEPGNSHMLGITETVFAPRPPPPLPQQEDNRKNIPMSILRLQALNNQQVEPSGGEISRNAGPPKIKRPMETNCLETGPPVKRTVHLDGSASGIVFAAPHAEHNISNSTESIPSSSVASGNSNGSSVLLNLLTHGEDVNHGYKINKQMEPSALHSAISKTNVAVEKGKSSGLRSLLESEGVRIKTTTISAPAFGSQQPNNNIATQVIVVQNPANLAAVLARLQQKQT